MKQIEPITVIINNSPVYFYFVPFCSNFQKNFNQSNSFKNWTNNWNNRPKKSMFQVFQNLNIQYVLIF